MQTPLENSRSLTGQKEKPRPLGRGLTGFTLVELMVAAAVFSIGIVFVLKSFLGIASVLDLMQNKGAALEFLSQKMGDLEEQSRAQGGMKPFTAQEEMTVRQRGAVFNSWSQELKTDEIMDPVIEAVLSVSWKNNSRNEEETVASYFPNKK
jgi:prepilin-type N-terminal cleavage/methylation domain-containing protein